MPLVSTFCAASARGYGFMCGRPELPELDVTWNPSDKDASITLSNGNRDAACTDSSFSSVRATLGRTSGKFYFEISKPQGEPGSARCGFGDGSFNLASFLGNTAKGYGLTTNESTNNGYTEAVNILPAADGYFSFAFDLDLGYAWIGQNNSWLGGGNPAAGTTPAVTGITGAVYPACSLYDSGSYRLHTKTEEMQGTVPSGFAVWAAPF